MPGEVQETCCSCGIGFCLPTPLYEARVRDHGRFYCPNGHAQHYLGKTKQEKEIEALEAQVRQLDRFSDELFAQREELIGALKECPIPGCSYRSRKQIPRDAHHAGRGVERVKRDLLEHLVGDHASQTRPDQPLELLAGEVVEQPRGDG